MCGSASTEKGIMPNETNVFTQWLIRADGVEFNFLKLPVTVMLVFHVHCNKETSAIVTKN